MPTRVDLSGGGRDFAMGKKVAFNRRFKSDRICGSCRLFATETGGSGTGALVPQRVLRRTFFL